MQYIRRRWPWLILGQALILSTLTALAVLLLSAGSDAAGWAYDAMMWGVLPLSGALTAYFAVRKGLASFAAFWLPPVLQTAVHWLISGFPPLSAGMPLVAALASILGAATAEETLRRGGKKRRKSRK